MEGEWTVKHKKTALAFSGLVLILAACSGDETEETTEENQGSSGTGNVQLEEMEGTIEHVHGIGYTDAEGVTFASHDGLKVYKDNEWMESPHHKNDYMGFNATEEGMYVSGHPGASSDLPNPLGLQKGKVKKQELESLGFTGESDFHLMGVGYENEAIYLLNSQPDDNLDTGFHRSFDGGETFEAMAAENLPEKLFQLAVHPSDEEMVAAAAESGVFLSTDAGETFERISETGQASGLTFTGNQLYFGLLQNEASFQTYDLESETITDIPLPDFGQDAVLYSAVHPEKEELTIFTMNGSSYMTEDEGETWKSILTEGEPG
ncbi:hypothetical protein CKW00_12085 [Salimicrobium humidisoli]|uniref:Beta-barrel assembly machine subunit BamC n=2 Tax=Bacillaceae TaxID=186817 RepID=A0A1I4Q3A9_9BACI|nr:hypothetical protein CKW00_12085 [Salimicrobium humidisoli]SFM34346.1 hypothetical protein SAMN04488054_1365 [Salibacterium qingdaonense]